jgi:hypothetical protein
LDPPTELLLELYRSAFPHDQVAHGLFQFIGIDIVAAAPILLVPRKPLRMLVFIRRGVSKCADGDP